MTYYGIIYYRGMKVKGERRKCMNNIEKQVEEIMIKLKEINKQLTSEVIQKATKEEMEQYIEIVDEITAKLEVIDSLNENE